ncbi:hypothetical protein [uncultured Fibrobacter sp.]|uniref:hypothetical protein n=1 Tax=uncultured Fibrobacter sp. TaxID=261512 RepID=UPI002803E818|nr:hypothetical protein [uncultured Fibrobacter sp.]
MAMLNDQFRDDEGKIDFLALGKEEYQYRMALIQGRLEKSERAKDAYEEALSRYSANVSNGSKGGRPRKSTTATQESSKNFPDTPGGSASPAGCAARKRIPPQESTTAAGESAEKLDPTNIGGSAASAGRAPRSPRAGEVSDSPKVSETPTTAELYDFAEAARLSEADAREWWELCTERGWKDRSGKPIRNWKKACERYCARRAINRMAKVET